MTGLYKSGSIFIEIIKADNRKYTIIRHVADIEMPEYEYTKKQVKKYTKNLRKPSPKEEAKFLLLKHI